MSFNENIHDYIETDNERDEGHVDTRERNLNCEGTLGCDMGIDVAG